MSSPNGLRANLVTMGTDLGNEFGRRFFEALKVINKLLLAIMSICFI